MRVNGFHTKVCNDCIQVCNRCTLFRIVGILAIILSHKQLKRKYGNNTFIVSDETINCYGCIVLTSGINTARFERNPVMYYMHDRDKGVIGRWENIRKDGTKLLADAVFDDGTELGAKVKHQVETGFLRTASVGLENIKYEEINGVKTIVECDLYEISIVDVPANENAVKLYAKGRKPVTLLSQLSTPKDSKNKDAQTLRVRLIDVLGLADTATDNEIVATVKELLKEPSNAEKRSMMPLITA